MYFHWSKLAAFNSASLLAWCAAAPATGCSSSVELGIDPQYNASLGGSSSLGTQPASSGGNSSSANGGSFNSGTGGHELVAGTDSAGGTNSTGSTSIDLNASGGSTSTGLPSTGSSGSGCLTVSRGYVTTNEFAGYAYTFATQSEVSASNPVTISPSCDISGCTPAFLANSVCATGVVGAASDYGSSAGITFNVNQPNASDPYDSMFKTSLGSYGLRVDYTNTARSPLRVQLIDTAWTTYCYELSPAAGTSYIPWSNFNTACWDDSGSQFSPKLPIIGIQMMVQGDSAAEVPFDFCLLCVHTFSGLQ